MKKLLLILLFPAMSYAQNRISTMSVSEVFIEPSEMAEKVIDIWFKIDSNITLNKYEDYGIGVYENGLVIIMYVRSRFNTSDNYLYFSIDADSYDALISNGFNYIDINSEHIFYFNKSNRDALLGYAKNKYTDGFVYLDSE